ncbi:MAG: hypothetical protein B7X06_04180, partial [Verrucomicrobia bacterium 21-51-4]
KRTRPMAVYGLGGFTTLTVGLGARLESIPLFLHASDRVVGRAIRLLSRFARCTYLPQGVRLWGIPQERQATAGYPLRPEMKRIDRAEARRALGFPETGRLLIILGGSQGATSLSEWGATHFERLAALGYHLYVATGIQKNRGIESIECTGPDGQPRYARFVSFCDTMATLLSAADWAITRAGAGTLAELEAFSVPAVVIPYPFAKDDHQNANADYFVKRGFGQKVDASCLGELMPLVAELSAQEIPWTRWKQNMEQTSNEDPLDLMMHDLQQIQGACK